MKYVLIGKLVNTHGLKGEVRILSDFKYKSKVFIPGMKIYLGKDKCEEEIVSYRHHKIFEMIMMANYHDINEVLKYMGCYVFVNKEDIRLDDGEYLDEDIIGLMVINDGKELGVVRRIDNHNGNQVLMITGEKEYLIPYNNNFIEKIDLNKKILALKSIKTFINNFL